MSDDVIGQSLSEYFCEGDDPVCACACLHGSVVLEVKIDSIQIARKDEIG